MITIDEAKAACNVLLCGVGHYDEFTDDGYHVEVIRRTMYINGDAIAKFNGRSLAVNAFCLCHPTTITLLNQLPNVHIAVDNGRSLNGKPWDGKWTTVVDDLYKHDDDL